MNSKQQLIQHCRQYLSHYDNSYYMREYSIRLVEWIIKVVSGSIIVTNTDITTKIIEAEYTAMIWDNNSFNVRLFIQLISDIVDNSNDDSSEDDEDSEGVTLFKPTSINPRNPIKSCDGITNEGWIPLVPEYNIFLLKNSDGVIAIKASNELMYVGKLNSDYTVDPFDESDALLNQLDKSDSSSYPITIMGINARLITCKRIAENLDNTMISRIKVNVTNPGRFNFV